MCVVFHHKKAKKKNVCKSLAQCKFSLNKVVVGFLNIDLELLHWNCKTR